VKILHIVRQFYPLIGGLENYVYNLAGQQKKHGYEVTVVTLDRNFVDKKKLDKYESLENGVVVHRIPYFFSRKYAIALSVYKFLKDQDLVHVHGVDFFSDFIAATKLFHQKKTILTTHGGFFHTTWGHLFKQVYFRTITRLSLKTYDAIIGCSDNDMEVFKGIAPGIIKIDNGVNVEPLLSVEKIPQGNTLLYVGRIDIHKRIDKLIRLIPALNKREYPVNLLIVGPDWKHLLPDLQKLVDDFQIRDQVTFTGPVSDRELISYYSEALLFVSASEYEGFGISAIEALASGTPCILNDIRSFRTILTNHSFGVLCDFNNIEETAEAIVDYSRKIREDYKILSTQAREMAKGYNWESVAEKVIGIYELNQQ